MRKAGRTGREGAGKRLTNRDGCELTRTGPRMRALICTYLDASGGTGSNGWWVLPMSLHTTHVLNSRFPPLWLRTIYFLIFMLRTSPFFSREIFFFLFFFLLKIRPPRLGTRSVLSLSQPPARCSPRSGAGPRAWSWLRLPVPWHDTTKPGDQASFQCFPYSWHDARLLSDQSNSLLAFSARSRSTTHQDQPPSRDQVTHLPPALASDEGSSM